MLYTILDRIRGGTKSFEVIFTFWYLKNKVLYQSLMVKKNRVRIYKKIERWYDFEPLTNYWIKLQKGHQQLSYAWTINYKEFVNIYETSFLGFLDGRAPWMTLEVRTAPK